MDQKTENCQHWLRFEDQERSAVFSTFCRWGLQQQEPNSEYLHGEQQAEDL